MERAEAAKRELERVQGEVATQVERVREEAATRVGEVEARNAKLEEKAKQREE